jgi:hypothetical protein
VAQLTATNKELTANIKHLITQLQHTSTIHHTHPGDCQSHPRHHLQDWRKDVTYGRICVDFWPQKLNQNKHNWRLEAA